MIIITIILKMIITVIIIMMFNRMKKEILSKSRLLQSRLALSVVQHWHIHLDKS